MTWTLHWRGTPRGRRASEPSAEELPVETEPAVRVEQTTVVEPRERQPKNPIEHRNRIVREAIGQVEQPVENVHSRAVKTAGPSRLNSLTGEPGSPA